MNRDSTKVFAKEFDKICKQQNRLGKFIFMSAEPSILQANAKYSDMKKEAEDYIISDEVGNLYSVILRPGLVYHETERPWSVPLGKAADLGSSVSGLFNSFGLLPKGPPGTDLRILSGLTIEQATLVVDKDNKEFDKSVRHHIITAKMMRKNSTCGL